MVTVAAGTAAPGRRQAMPFQTAFENYLGHLKSQAEAKGKPPRWWLNATKLYEAHIKPQWGGWTLAEMSQSPAPIPASIAAPRPVDSMSAGRSTDTLATSA